jgi:hypothetical protein
MDITTATPAEIDAQIAKHDAAASAAFDAIMKANKRIDDVAKAGDRYYGPLTADDEIAKQRALIEKVTPMHRAALAAAVPLVTEYRRRGGWTRWYLVEGGHLHYDVSGSRCSRIPSTSHYWMTDHSGRSAAEMIELAGDRVCTTCFPDAPVAPRPATGRFMTLTEAERAAHAEQKALKLAAKKAAELRTPDGGPLIVGRNDHLKTDAAAWRRLLSDAFDLAWYGKDHSDAPQLQANVRAIVCTLAHARGVTDTALRAQVDKKVADKIKAYS